MYVPSTFFQLNRDGSSWVEPVLSWDKCVLLKDHKVVTPVRLEPTAPQSQVKHSTTEPLRSLMLILYNSYMYLYNIGGSRRGMQGVQPPSLFLNIGFCNGKFYWATHCLKLHCPPPPPHNRETFMDKQIYNLCVEYRKKIHTCFM